MAEQKKEAETNKTKELAKQIAQEREQEELDRISGKKTVMDRGIDWMYQGGTTGDLAKEDAEKRAEEFLMGKDYVGDGAAQGDFDDGDQQTGIHNVVAKMPAVASQPEQQHQDDSWKNEPSVKDRNETFRMRVEDPMFLVSQKEREKINKHEKTKALYERVVGHAQSGNESDNGDEVDRKKSRKDKKQHTKKRSRREDDSDRKSRRRRRSRSRSRSNERHRSHRRRDRSRSRSRSRSFSDDSRRNRHHDERRREDRSHRHREEHSRRKDYHDDRIRDHRRDERRRSDEARYSRHRRAGSEEHHYKRHDKSDNHRKHESDSSHHRHGRSNHRHGGEKSPGHEPESLNSRKKEGYGLKGASVPFVNTNDLGPSRDLLKKKRDARDTERRRIQETASSRRRTTDEDRAKALQEMQADARKRDENMKRQAFRTRKEDEDEDKPSSGQASFLNDITTQTHGIKGAGSLSLSARVAQNRHTNQRLHDSFL